MFDKVLILLSLGPHSDEDGAQTEGERPDDEGGSQENHDVGGGEELGDEAQEGRAGEVEDPREGLGERVGEGEVVWAQLVREKGGVDADHDARGEAGSKGEGPRSEGGGGEGDEEHEGPGCC